MLHVADEVLWGTAISVIVVIAIVGCLGWVGIGAPGVMNACEFIYWIVLAILSG